MLALTLLQAGLMYSLMTGVQALRCKVVKSTTTNNTAAPPIAADTATHTLAPLSHPAMWSVTYDDRYHIVLLLPLSANESFQILRH